MRQNWVLENILIDLSDVHTSAEDPSINQLIEAEGRTEGGGHTLHPGLCDYGDVVPDSFNKTSRDEDYILDQIFKSKYICYDDFNTL